MKNLLLLCGGQSPEHTISIKSARNILKALDRDKYDITIVGINTEGGWRLVNEEELGDKITDQGKPVVITPGLKAPFNVSDQSLGEFDVVFPVLHGPMGEDGTVQGLLTLLEIPFVGPGVLASSASMDKDTAKRILRDAGINVAPWWLLRKADKMPSYAEVESSLGNPVFVKPSNMGSSVGVHRVENEKEWNSAVKDAFIYDRKVLVETSIKGRELECAVLGNDYPQASGVGEVQSGNFYSFDEKYHSESSADIIIPANIEKRYLPILQEIAIKAYKALDCEGLSRVDMFLTDEGKVFVNEVNTIPGFTNISIYPKLWETEGMTYSALLDKLIDLAIERG